MFNLVEVANQFLRVRKQIKTPGGDWVDDVKPEETQYMSTWFSRTIEEGNDVEVFSTFDKKVILDVLEYGVSNDSIYPKLTVDPASSNENYNDQLFHVINSGSGRSLPSVSNLESRGSQLLEVVNSGTNTGKVMLKNSIVLPEGARLSFSIVSGTGDVTYKVMWREIDG